MIHPWAIARERIRDRSRAGCGCGGYRRRTAGVPIDSGSARVTRTEISTAASITAGTTARRMAAPRPDGEERTRNCNGVSRKESRRASRIVMGGRRVPCPAHGTWVAPASKLLDRRYPVHQRIHLVLDFSGGICRFVPLVPRSRSSRAPSSAFRWRPLRPRGPGSPVSVTTSIRAAARHRARPSRGRSRRPAAGGEISVLDPGGFGAVTITKSITISGVGENASILGSLTNGINISAGVNDVVTLHNIQINGFTNGLIGIRFLAGKALVLDDVRVFGFATGIQTEAGNTTINRSSFTNNRSFAIHALSNSTISGRGHDDQHQQRRRAGRWHGYRSTVEQQHLQQPDGLWLRRRHAGVGGQ